MKVETLLAKAPNTTQWLFNGAKELSFPPLLVNAFMECLNQDGFSILRSNTGLAGLHPQIKGRFYRWKLENLGEIIPFQDEQVGQNTYEYDNGIVTEIFWGYKADVEKNYKAGPWHIVLDQGLILKRHIQPDDDEKDFEFSIYKDLQNHGVTSYLGIPINLKAGARNCFADKSAGARNGMTLATTKDGGFTDVDIEILTELIYQFMLHVQPYQEYQTTKILLETYLGPQTGERVLQGRICRGDLEAIEAAIWFSDLRGFTSLSNQIAPEHLLQVLNVYFHTIATVIKEYKGEILKFIGDAVLAIFPVSGTATPQEVCHRALEAAKKANSELEIINQTRTEQRLPLVNHGIGLHIGTVQYGNIGALDRLDFTVIGAAVNFTSRIEGLCGKLEKQTLASEVFVKNIKDKTKFLGEFEFKGFSDKQKVYSLSQR